MTKAFFRTETFYILLAVAVVGGGIGYRQYRRVTAPPEHETATVARGTLEQVVEATGKVEAVQDIDLKFDVPGTIAKVNVREGSRVKARAILATLKLAELNAAVAQASANLRQKLAGATKQDRAYYKAAMESASASLEQARAEAAPAIAKAEADVATARNNLKLAEGGDNSQIVNEAYEDTVAVLQATLTKLDDALTQADNILGLDNKFANDAFEKSLGVLDSALVPLANNRYQTAKASRDRARVTVLPLTAGSAHNVIDGALDLIQETLLDMNQLLVAVADVLKATVPTVDLTQTTLDAKKTTIETTRSTIVTQYTNSINQKQTITDAKNSYSTYQIAYDKALKNLEEVKVTTASTIKIKQAAYDQAVAGYRGKIDPPREVDVAALRAAVAAAVASRDKAIIRAPIDGVVSKVHHKAGESVSSADPINRLLSPGYEIQVDIAETDVPKVRTGQKARLTLDAFGAERQWEGTVVAIEPASTEIQDVVYYRVTVRLVPSKDGTLAQVKPGMTANVVISSQKKDDALYVPTRALRTSGGGRRVLLLENGEEKEMVVSVGIRTNDGKTEITSGLTEGQTIIVSTEAKK